VVRCVGGPRCRFSWTHALAHRRGLASVPRSLQHHRRRRGSRGAHHRRPALHAGHPDAADRATSGTARAPSWRSSWRDRAMARRAPPAPTSSSSARTGSSSG
jgi:hypothetical protein